MEDTIVIGAGEVGQAIIELEEDARHGVAVVDKKYDSDPPQKKYKVMHVCIPFTPQFISDVDMYIQTYSPSLVIVHSTVPVGTTEQLNPVTSIVHSPVRGKHPNLAKSLRAFHKYVGGPNPACISAIAYMRELGVKSTYIGDYKATELAKLLDTTYYGWCIAFAERASELCSKYGVDYDFVYTDWNQTYNEGYTRLGVSNVVRPVLDPPQGGLGGHCLTSNAILLRESEFDAHTSHTASDVVLSLGFKTSDGSTYQNKDWLYCEYIGKQRTTWDIAQECGVSTVTIRNWLHKNGLPVRGSPWIDEERSLLRELSLEMTFKEISNNRLMDRSYEAIRIQASKDNIISLYDPSNRDEEICKKISCTLQGIDKTEFDGFKYSEREKIQKSKPYQEWRLAVFERDDYTCQAKDCSYCSNVKGAELNAHHITPFMESKERRLDLTNGITYCIDYHKDIHKKD